MHHHNQTIADIERSNEPSDLAIFAGFVAAVLAFLSFTLFLFTL